MSFFAPADVARPLALLHALIGSPHAPTAAATYARLSADLAAAQAGPQTADSHVEYERIAREAVSFTHSPR